MLAPERVSSAKGIISSPGLGACADKLRALGTPGASLLCALLCLVTTTGCSDGGGDVQDPNASLGGNFPIGIDAGNAGLIDASAVDAVVASTLDASVGVDGGDGAAAPTDANGGVQAARRSSVVDHAAWRIVGAAEDPFDDRLPEVTCDPAAVMSELLGTENVFSVDTGACNYVTAVQPSVRAVAAGETFNVRLWHFTLSAPMPAEAHASIVIDDVTLLDERIPIPHEGGLVQRQVVAPHELPIGTPVWFHLHNHGENSWALVEVSAGP